MTTLAASPPSFTFDGVVRLTRIGTTYVFFTIVVGFAALNTGNNALYIGLTFMLGCLLLSGMASKGGLKRLSVEVLNLGEAWAGRPSDAILLVRNRSVIWNVRDVVITAPEIARPVLIPLIPRKGLTTVAVPFLFQRRGRVELKPVDFYTRYPFGLFLKKRRAKLTGELVVFPRLLDAATERQRFRPTTGEQNTANRLGAGTEIHSLREYVRGDSLRHVHWKKSASLGRWIIKQTDQDATHTIQVVMDPFVPPGVTLETFEDLISAAATFVHDALERRLDVELVMPRLSVRSKDGQSAHSLFRALALIEPSHVKTELIADAEAVVFSVRDFHR